MANDNIMITDIRGDKRRYLALATLRMRLRTELRGMKFTTRGATTLQLCKEWGYEGPRSKEKALVWVDAEMKKILDDAGTTEVE